MWLRRWLCLLLSKGLSEKVAKAIDLALDSVQLRLLLLMAARVCVCGHQ